MQKNTVLVIGGGHAGLCAAITAKEMGANVILIEAGSKVMRGGNSRHTRNLRAMHDVPTATLVDRYDEEEYWQDLLRVTKGVTDEVLARLMIRESEALLYWLTERGVRFQPSLKGTLSLDRTNAFFLGGGCALVNALYRHAEQIGVDIHYDQEVREIELDNNTFYQALTPDQAYAADAVVFACGGFQANTEWMVEAWGEGARNFLIRGTELNRGYVLKALMSQDVTTIGDPTQCHAVAIDARAPKFDGGIVSRLDSVPFGIVVNQAGHRFYDEGEDVWPKRYAIWGRLVADQPGQIAYSIIDQQATENFMPSVLKPVEADSIEALATKLNIPEPTLSQTINEFNEATQPGRFNGSALDGLSTSGLTPPKTNWARPISQPPFYAYPLRPGITFTYYGLKVDSSARVHMTDGHPSSNMFAAGEIMAGNILGQGYCAGTGMTIGGVFGRIAGEQAAHCH